MRELKNRINRESLEYDVLKCKNVIRNKYRENDEVDRIHLMKITARSSGKKFEQERKAYEVLRRINNDD